MNFQKIDQNGSYCSKRMIKLYSEGNTQFDYYPFISSGKFYEKRDKTGAYCNKREFNANHQNKKNPKNVIPILNNTFRAHNGRNSKL